MHFLAVFTVAVSILFTTIIPMEPLVYSVSSSLKAKMFIFLRLYKNNKADDTVLCKSITRPNPTALNLSFHTTLGDSFV